MGHLRKVPLLLSGSAAPRPTLAVITAEVDALNSVHQYKKLSLNLCTSGSCVG